MSLSGSRVSGRRAGFCGVLSSGFDAFTARLHDVHDILHDADSPGSLIV